MKFNELGLHSVLTEKCGQMGFVEPTPIQQKAIPAVMAGTDLIACAETGTGKTAAFLLPILHRLLNGQKGPGTRVLVLSPTRELANQTEEACRKLAPKGITCTAIIGGSGYKRQMDSLRAGANVVIATPGRLLDLMTQGAADFRRLTTLVLDEADRMLDMGFLPSIKRIVKALPEDRQTLFFSATMSGEVERIAYSMLREPEVVEIGPRGRASGLIEQSAYPVAPNSKMVLLLELLEKEELERVLVFTRTKRGADRLAHVLEKRSHSSNRIHGDRSQSQRDAALRAFKAGKTNVLVATDVAARGIDIDSVQHVINYDIPEAPEDYVHRIGRTGRAGNKGRAITIFTLAEEHSMRAIERLTGEKVARIIHPEHSLGFPAADMRTTADKGTPKRTFRSFGSRRRRAR
ncbi:MAG: DEAD/DEAH box helicase [Acidobacteria bacterium]|nr:DEAD/DEAH box helicase [Acidobacteriota bacterium]MCW5947980.1 DEAD/DEAH box helicase [Pyrinomonadaceae bacterium]